MHRNIKEDDLVMTTKSTHGIPAGAVLTVTRVEKTSFATGICATTWWRKSDGRGMGLQLGPMRDVYVMPLDGHK